MDARTNHNYAYEETSGMDETATLDLLGSSVVYGGRSKKIDIEPDHAVRSLVHNGRNRYARKLDVDVMKRILGQLEENTSLNITNLSMFSGLNLNTCKRHLHMMNVFGWVRISFDGRKKVINQTEPGRKVYRSLIYHTD